MDLDKPRRPSMDTHDAHDDDDDDPNPAAHLAYRNWPKIIGPI